MENHKTPKYNDFGAFFIKLAFRLTNYFLIILVNVLFPFNR